MAHDYGQVRRNCVELADTEPFIRLFNTGISSPQSAYDNNYAWQMSVVPTYGYLSITHNSLSVTDRTTNKNAHTLVLSGNLMIYTSPVENNWNAIDVDNNSYNIVINGGTDTYGYNQGGLWAGGNINGNSFTTRTTSDISLKTISEIQPSYIDKIKTLGDVQNYRYIKSDIKGLALDIENLHDGLIYQNAVKANIPDFTGTTKDGYGYVNYLSSDYQAILLGAVQQLIKRVEELEKKL